MDNVYTNIIHILFKVMFCLRLKTFFFYIIIVISSGVLSKKQNNEQHWPFFSLIWYTVQPGVQVNSLNVMLQTWVVRHLALTMIVPLTGLSKSVTRLRVYTRGDKIYSLLSCEKVSVIIIQHNMTGFNVSKLGQEVWNTVAMRMRSVSILNLTIMSS